MGDDDRRRERGSFGDFPTRLFPNYFGQGLFPVTLSRLWLPYTIPHNVAKNSFSTIVKLSNVYISPLFFYPRDALLSRNMLWPCVRLSVCLSQVVFFTK